MVRAPDINEYPARVLRRSDNATLTPYKSRAVGVEGKLFILDETEPKEDGERGPNGLRIRHRLDYDPETIVRAQKRGEPTLLTATDGIETYEVTRSGGCACGSRLRGLKWRDLVVW